jgi:hypothetical protein
MLKLMKSSKQTNAVRAHFSEVGTDIKLFFSQTIRNPFVTFNLIFTLVLTFSAMEKFGRTGPQDVTHFTDMSFSDSSPPPNVHLTAGISVLADIHLHNDTACLTGEAPHHMYNAPDCYGGQLGLGRSGIFEGGMLGFEQNSFNVPHFLWVSSWFVTPIALFLVANASWSVFNQWMWWVLYVFVMVWDVVGLLLMLVWHQSPTYNKIIAFVYFSFSSLLMISVRETWRVLSDPSSRDENGDDVTMPMKSHNPAGVPDFMQGLSLGVSKVGATTKGGSGYVPLAFDVAVPVSSEVVPTVLAHTFTRTVLILCEFFFLVPVVASTAFVMSQERVIPFDVQLRAWQASLLFGIVVVLEKARKTRLSYMSDTVLVMAAVVALFNVLYSTIPEIMWTLTNVPMGLAISVMYACLSLIILIAIVNVGVNMVYITFGGNDKGKMEELQSTDAPVLSDTTVIPKTRYTRTIVAMYYLNVSVLVIVKLLLMVVVVLGMVQNRSGNDTPAILFKVIPQSINGGLIQSP